MPHRCVKCEVLYPDDAQEIFSGCVCGSTVFLFVRPPVEKNGVTTIGEGKYTFNLGKLFAKNPVTSSREGKYEIDLETALGKRPNL